MTATQNRVQTGISGLDHILQGGLHKSRSYLVRGAPGTGKTILGLSFLTAAAPEETSLYITFGEPVDQIKRDAHKLGLPVDQVDFLTLAPQSDFFAEQATYDIFSPADVERGPVAEKIIERVEETTPDRVFIDSMTQLRYLAASPEQVRRQSLSLIRFLNEQGATVLFSSESSPEARDDDLQFLSDGILELSQEGSERFVEVKKFRGGGFTAGPHGLSISESGIRVFPRLVPELREREFSHETISSGVPEIDELLGGGLDRGTATIISGPSGVGKTTLGMQFMKEAAGRGERSVLCNFEEEEETLLYRCDAINMPARAMMEQGKLAVQSFRAWRFAPDAFTQHLQREVEDEGARIVMIDSLTGMTHAMPDGRFSERLQALTKYLVNRDVTVIYTDEVPSITGEFKPTNSAVSYVVDNLVFLRYLEIKGAMRKAIGVLKKRTSDFEKQLREFEITKYGLKVGKPLRQLRGILSGSPEWIGDSSGATNASGAINAARGDAE